MNFVCSNGKFLPSSTPLFTARNRSFKWGDGIFETIKVCSGKLALGNYHFERLFTSLQLLEMNCPAGFTEDMLRRMIIALCEKNNCIGLARVRLAVYRDEENQAAFVIEAYPLTAAAIQWNKKGFRIGLYPYARKPADAFSNLKSASFLPYVLADRYATQHGLDDVLLLNTDNRIADSSRANVFLVRKGELYTPALNQGCVGGVTRKYLIEQLHQNKYTVHQQPLEEQHLLEADEIFLTNAIFGLRWVRQYRDREYGHEMAHEIHRQFILPACDH